MTTAKAITDVIVALRAERGPLAARLDAIDLAIDNLGRVYGMNSTPPSRPIEERRKKLRKVQPEAPTLGRSVEAIARRDLIVGLIRKSAHGLTGRELRLATPKMDEKGRSNALSILRAKGQIKRAGNVWVSEQAA